MFNMHAGKENASANKLDAQRYATIMKMMILMEQVIVMIQTAGTIYNAIAQEQAMANA